jgi:ABC-type sugar transport system substrate-binding protein
MRRRRTVLFATGALVAIAAVLSLSAASLASSSNTSAASGVAAAKAAVAKAMKPPVWAGPTTKVDISKAKGKKVYFINLTEGIPALHEWSVVLGQQLKAAGVDSNDCDAKGTPNGITTCLTQALAAKPAAIVALALDNKFIATYMAKAKAAGIPFITGQTGTPGLPTSPSGRVAEVTFDYGQVGRILGAWFAADSNCTGSPQIITTTSSREPSAAEVAGIQAALKQYCPSLKQRSVQNVLIPDWATKLPTTTRSDLLADPSLKYLLPLYDGMTIYMNPAIKQAQADSRVRMGSFNATPVVMQTEVSKKTPLIADVGGPNQWYAVALADEVLRVITGGKVVANEKVPLRLFTGANIGSINVKKDESTWYGKINPICNYHKLWGISGC